MPPWGELGVGVVRNGSFLSVRMPLPERLCPSGVLRKGGLIGSLGLMRGRGGCSSLRTFIGGSVGEIGPATMGRGVGALG